MDRLARSFEYAFSGEARFRGYVQPVPYIIEGPFMLGENEVVPIQVEHGKIHTFGFLIRQEGRPILGYISDCKIISDQGLHDLTGVEVLVLGTPLKMSRFSHLSICRRTGFDLLAKAEARLPHAS